jgi:crotonobetainyl-CoA:carnitine CoA-transferase CaiB-like acyl-CoA transferase
LGVAPETDTRGDARDENRVENRGESRVENRGESRVGSVAQAGRHETLLRGLNIVDLAGEPAVMAGRILSDLGAAVTRVELKGQDPLRHVVPLAPDGISLRYKVWNAGKSVLAMDGTDDPELTRLLAEADAVIDTPGWPGSIHLDPARAPRAVWVSVSPFGLEGPRSRWNASDLGVMASTANMYCTGDPDRAPVRCTEPTAWAHTGPEAALATLTALATGRPQLVDVSAQEVVMIASMGHVGRYPRTLNRGKRSGANIGVTREIWPCADGFVSFGLRGGKARIPNLETITRLVADDGILAPALSGRDWTTYDHTKCTPEELEEISAPIAAYFARHTMAELYEIAVETNLMLAPANSPPQLIESRQLAERNFFTDFPGTGTIPRTFVHVTSPGDVLCQPGPDHGVTADPSAGPGAATGPMTARLGDRGAQARASTPTRKAPVPGPGAENANGAWSGTTIVEVGTGAAGPIAVRYFAEHGARVIRIESRTRPDFLRTYGSNGPHGLEGSDMFDSLNVGKLGITLNLKHPEGSSIARRLIAMSDAVAENYAPRAMKGFGLDYASLVGTIPDLVMISSCLQGQTGPHRDYPGFGGQGSALGGYNFLTGWPDREPIGPFGTITDSLAPRFTAAALAAGLLYKRRTGNGVHLDVSQVEAAVYSLSPWIADYTVNNRIEIRQGNSSDRFSPHGAFRCEGEDSWVAVACRDDRDWTVLAGLLELDEQVAARFSSIGSRRARREEIEDLLTGWTSKRPASEVAETLQGAGIEAIPVADFEVAFGDLQLRHRGHFVALDHPLMGECFYERNGFRLSDAAGGYTRTSPLLGEHNEFVLGELLGISKSEVDRLTQDGVLS